MDGFRSRAEIGRRIAQLRQARGWDQQELGSRLNLDQPAISRIERGQRGLSALELHLLAREFGVLPESIVARDEPEPALLRVGDASDEQVTRGLEVLERAVKAYFGAEALAEFLRP
jgi:transcriptional regulator with XRE-family HTH domain